MFEWFALIFFAVAPEPEVTVFSNEPAHLEVTEKNRVYDLAQDFEDDEQNYEQIEEPYLETDISIVLENEDDEVIEVKPSRVDLSLIAQLPSETCVAPEEVDPFETLLITREDKRNIMDLLMTMADNNVLMLLFEKKRLERLGQEINHVHPCRFLETIFTDPRLIYCMRQIRHSGFKWDGFIEGFVERMRLEVENGNMDKYLDGFAKRVNVDARDLRSHIEHDDFEGFVLFLMAQSKR